MKLLVLVALAFGAAAVAMPLLVAAIIATHPWLAVGALDGPIRVVVPTPVPAPTAIPTPSGGGDLGDVVDLARDWLGVPYSFGGCSRRGVDCSCFVMLVYRAALIRQLSKGARDAPELVEQTCAACGTSFQTRAALVRAGQGKTCSPACANARRAEGVREHHPSRTAPEAWRQWTRLSARAQWRQNPRYRRIAAALRTLEPAAFADLTPRDRQMLAWYYALDEGEALDHTEIAARLDTNPKWVSSRLHRVLAQLLGGHVVHAPGDRGGTTPDRCGVCRGIDRLRWRSASDRLDNKSRDPG